LLLPSLQTLALHATVPCLDAIALIDQQLLAGGPEQEQAIEKQSRSARLPPNLGAIGTLVQPLIGERVFGTLKATRT
jgi:hypothetical protein